MEDEATETGPRPLGRAGRWLALGWAAAVTLGFVALRELGIAFAP